MSRVRVHMTMTLDGYVAGPNQSAEKPFGEGAEHIHDWLFELRSFRELHGMEGGETGPSDDVVRETASNLGATVMGRNMFGGGANLANQYPAAGQFCSNRPSSRTAERPRRELHRAGAESGAPAGAALRAGEPDWRGNGR